MPIPTFSFTFWAVVAMVWAFAGYFVWNTRFRAWVIVCVVGLLSAGAGMITAGNL